MKIEIYSKEEQLHGRAAEMIADIVQSRTQPFLGLATGGTPEGTYKALIEQYQTKRIYFQKHAYR